MTSGDSAIARQASSLTRLLPSDLMADACYTIHPPLDAERIMSAQLLDHAAALDGQGRPTGDCRVCRRLPAGLTLTVHQARLIRNRLVQAGLMTMDEPH
jgi:hypothetical protein